MIASKQSVSIVLIRGQCSDFVVLLIKLGTFINKWTIVMATVIGSNRMFILIITISTFFLLSTSKEVETENPLKYEDSKTENKIKIKESEDDKKLKIEGNKEDSPDVNTRFFDLGGFFNPNFNQIPGGNSGTNLPSQNQYYPYGGAQNNFPQGSGQDGYQNGGFQQYPNQGNYGPNQNQGFNPEYSNGPNGNQWQQNPNQGGYQGSDYYGQPNNYPMNNPGPQTGGNNQNGYPNQQMGSYNPNFNNQGPNQYPNHIQGSIPPVSGGLHTQVQSKPWDQQQYLNQPQPIENPDMVQQNQFPNQNNQRPLNNPGFNNYPAGNGQNNQYPNYPQNQNINQYPISDQNINQYPNSGQNFQRPNQGGFMNQNQQGQVYNQQRPTDQYPNQGGMQNGGNYNGDGTLDDIVPTSPPRVILGKPVRVPPNTISPDQIYFEDSSESPSQTQCVQDCPATPEYKPVCGTNNVTYFNPGKFQCARNCGVRVFVLREGVCVRRPV